MKSLNLAVALLAACLIGQPAWASCQKAGTAARQIACAQPSVAHKLRQQMLRSLKDPEGARLRDAKLYESEDGLDLAVCGVVNAKNSYGGFVGESPFISSSTGLVRIANDEPQAFETLWSMFCARQVR